MPIRVQVGGKIVEFPDGTTEDVMRKALSTLTPDPTPTSLDMVSGRMGRETSLAEGQTQPGLLSGMVSAGQNMAHPGIDMETGKAKGKLATAGDFSMLALPSLLGTSAAEAASRYWQGTKAAARDTKSMRDVATLPVRAYQNVKDALPSSNTAAIEQFMPKGEGYTPKAPTFTSGGADLVDKYLPQVKPAEVPKPPMAKAPSLDEALQSALEQNMGADPAKASTLAETPMTGGAQKPKVGKRPGGYTTDIPARGKAVEGEGAVAPEGVTRSPADRRAGTGKIDKLSETSQGADQLEQLLSALHPGEDIPHINPEGHGSMAAPSGFQETMRSTEPEMVEHFGTEPGTPEAASGRAHHKMAGEMDADYKRRLEDPLASFLLAALGGGTLASRSTTSNQGGLP